METKQVLWKGVCYGCFHKQNENISISVHDIGLYASKFINDTHEFTLICTEFPLKQVILVLNDFVKLNTISELPLHRDAQEAIQTILDIYFKS